MNRPPEPGADGASTEGMKAGGYYDAHSEYQRRIIEGGDQLIRSVASGLSRNTDDGAVAVADYGAGTGATSVHAVGTAIAALRTRDASLPVVAIHNDVLTNDFTQLFHNVDGDDSYLKLSGGPIYAIAAAGSFFTQVLPAGMVNIGMCSNAAHWFREQPRAQIPDGMFFSDATGPTREAIAAQAAEDWAAFLNARAAELAPEGQLLVQGIGTSHAEDGTEQVSAGRLLHAMWLVAEQLAQEGLLKQEVLGDYVFPVYCRSPDELRAPAAAGGPLADALEVVSIETDEVANPYWEAFQQGGDAAAYAAAYVQFVRAFAESTMTAHLFAPGAASLDPAKLCDEYFKRLEGATAADPDGGRYEAWVVRAVFARR